MEEEVFSSSPLVRQENHEAGDESEKSRSQRNFASKRKFRGKRPSNPKNDSSNLSTSSSSCCCVCSGSTPKYKCPKCLAPYCSVVCCKSHKEKGCADSSSLPPKSVPELASPAVDESEGSGVTLDEAQKGKLQNSAQLASLLRSKRLQRHFLQIQQQVGDSRRTKLRELRQKHSEFEEVVNILLEVVK